MLEKQADYKSKTQVLLRKLFFFLLAFSLFLLIDHLAIYLADLMLKGSFKYTWLIAHHVIQIFLALLVMALPFWGRSLSGWGLNTKNFRLTLKILGKFTLGWIVFTTLYTLVTQWLSGWPPLLDFELTLENVIIYLVFESTVVGISEELVFRGLVQGVLGSHFSKQINLPGFSISLAGIITALFFALAHIGFQLSPLAITAFAPMQIIIAFALGTFYAVLREQTGSLLGPVLTHNISDSWLSVLYIVIQTIRG